MDITVAITTYNEGVYLDRLLMDLSSQVLEGLQIEVVLLEAGDYDESRARKHLGCLGDRLVFLHCPGLSRTESLNKIFSLAHGELIVRLDARSHIPSMYLANIVELSSETGAENVGGVMLPIGLTENQSIIAEIMKHPLAFGGGKSRALGYRGYADSVYLGAFAKDKCNFGSEWFDSVHSKISEDSDLNYRLRKNGGKVFIDSSIVVEHYPRESLPKFFRLCYNYGVGRGLFLIKHKIFSAYRQAVPILMLFLCLFLLLAGFSDIWFHYALIGILFVYVAGICYASSRITKDWCSFIKTFFGFSGGHFFWIIGLLMSLIIYRADVKKLNMSLQ